MSKRKLNLRQTQRIIQSQKNQSETGETQTGLVLCRHGKKAEIHTPEGLHIDCYIRPNVPTLVAGDEVAWQPLQEKQGGVIVSCYPRESVLERLDKQGHSKPLAANLSQLIVVLAAKPTPIWTLIDSYLITAEEKGLQACLVLNKIDLPSDEERSILETYYQPLGYPVFFISHQDSKSYEALQAQLTAHTSIFLGQSGVGKSSLTATFLPHVAENIAVSPLSNEQHGQHTTSYSRYYQLSSRGAMIDSPGVRSYQPANLSIAQIIKGYRELHPFIGQCKFRNCNHIGDLGCAFSHALATHAISAFRYAHFIKLLQENR